MKRLYLIGLVLLLFAETNAVFGQEKLAQSNVLQHYADSIYGDLSVNIPSGYLLNRTLTDTNSLIFNLPKWKDSTVTADYFYQAVSELGLMKVRSSNVPDMLTLFDEVRSYVGGIEFKDDKTVIPIGILDINYEWLDEKSGLSKGLIKQSAGRFLDNAQAKSVYFRKNVQLTAPLYDYFVLDAVAITFRKEHFYSNYRTADDISAIVLTHNGVSRRINFDEIYNIETGRTDEQFFTVKIIYTNGQEIENTFKIHTPKDFELSPDGAKKKDDGFVAKSGNSFPNKRLEFGFTINKNGQTLQLEYCFIPSFCNPEVEADKVKYKPIKPYILVTGYRPPLFGQSFEKTWNIYSDNHDHLLHQLRLNGYDIILVRFNMAEEPKEFGMQEMAQLFVMFLEDLNLRKGANDYSENVIQGSSMGADVVRLALLKMENKHLHNNNYAHHHSRLFVSYDANYYGANLPLAYQLQAYSGVNYPMPVLPALVTALLPPPLNVLAGLGNIFLQVYLRQTLEQKATKELLMYHAKGMGNEGFVGTHTTTKTWTPTHTQLRQDFLNAVNNEYDQVGYYPHGKLFMPVPVSTRNVAISLGKVSEPNSENSQNIAFNQAGE
ncbi:MAG TPA: hypothetical protein PLP27_09985, partial [Crocinitomicaceae bacterium]|nr:hypothetical protein [Crocinitomicaceae bacterium]